MSVCLHLCIRTTLPPDLVFITSLSRTLPQFLGFTEEQCRKVVNGSHSIQSAIDGLLGTSSTVSCVVFICTAVLCLFVQLCCVYLYSCVVFICTVMLCLFVQLCCVYLYSCFVFICTADVLCLPVQLCCVYLYSCVVYLCSCVVFICTVVLCLFVQLCYVYLYSCVVFICTVEELICVDVFSLCRSFSSKICF